MLVRRSAFKGKYDAVPGWAAGCFSVVAVAFCLVVYGLLWTWGECREIPEIQQSCAVRAFPIFTTVYESAEDFSFRSCSCNTLFYVSENCTARGRHASSVLNISAAILQPTTIVMIQACPSDTELLRTLELRARAPVVIKIEVAPEQAPPVVDAANSSFPAATTTSSFTWMFPPRFGYYRQQQPGGDENNDVLPLVGLNIQGQMRQNNNTRTVATVRLGNLPSALGLMSTLIGLELIQVGLTEVPSS